MSDFDPDAYLKKKAPAPDFDPDAYLSQGFELDVPSEPPAAEPGTPLAKALAEQAGDVVTVETPTGSAKFTRSGARFFDPAESQQMFDAGNARDKEKTLGNALTFFGSGGPTAFMNGLSAVTRPGAISGRRKDESAIELFRRKRDDAKRSMGLAERHGPQASVAGVKFNPVALAGAATPSILAPNPATVLGRIGLGGFLGAEQSARQSDADLTKGEVVPFLKDTGKGLALGAGSGGVVEGLTAPMRWISRGAASRIGDSVATRAAADTADVAGEVASIRGQLGGESQKMSRMFENTQRAAGGGVAPAGQSAIDPALQGRALLALSDPSTTRLQEKVLNRTLNEMPGQQAVVERLEQELAQRSAGAAQEAGQRTADYFAEPVFRSEVAPRLGRLAYNAGTGAATGAGAGAALGFGSMLTGVGDPLTAAGVGLATGLTQGLGKSAITMSRNAMASPRVQVGSLGALIQASQAAQSAARGGARSVTAAGPRLQEGEEDAIQAFLAGN